MTSKMAAPQSAALKTVANGELCTGCGLCSGISKGAISMGTLAPGYARPDQREPITETQEATIAAACPGLRVASWQGKDERDRHNSPYWGPWLQCLTGAARAPDVRHKGASGGALSALSIFALESGLVEQVLHVTAAPDQPTRNINQLSRSRADVLDGAGSRYGASSPLSGIESLLSDGTPTLFIGKPCDVSALRELARRDERVNRTFPLMMSFFCGGLPSHAGADRIIRAMGLSPEAVTQFRYRGEGWPGLTRAVDKDGQVGEMRYEDSWGGHLSKEVQFRCKICPDAVGGVADIACADAWYGGETGYPQFEEQDGRSLILSRSAAGEDLLNKAIQAGALDTETLPIADVLLMQPSQARRKRRVGARVLASRLMLQPVPAMTGLNVGTAAKMEKLPGLLRDFLGTARRIMKNER